MNTDVLLVLGVRREFAGPAGLCQLWRTRRAAFGLETATTTVKKSMESARSCTAHLNHDTETLSKAVQQVFLETWSPLKCAHVPWHETREFCFCVILRRPPRSKPPHLLRLRPFQFLSVQDSIWKRLRKRTEKQNGLRKKKKKENIRERSRTWRYSGRRTARGHAASVCWRVSRTTTASSRWKLHTE